MTQEIFSIRSGSGSIFLRSFNSFSDGLFVLIPFLDSEGVFSSDPVLLVFVDFVLFGPPSLSVVSCFIDPVVVFGLFSFGSFFSVFLSLVRWGVLFSLFHRPFRFW